MTHDPRSPRHRPRPMLLLTLAILLGALVGAVFVGQLRRPRLTAELRGHDLAQQLGCFSCHGPDGTGGTPNPGSEEEAVPAWDGGNVMMYVENEQEIREWILDGHPERLADEASPGAEDHGEGDQDEHESEHRGGHRHGGDENPLLDMPAYRSAISDTQLEDLVAYYKVIAAFDPIDAAVRPGYRIARDNACFGCHGPRGLVGRKNPRSFKGYVPPWRGSDYRELVRDGAELREWILKGHIERFESNPVASFFTGRQIIQMPAYEGRLSAEEIDELVAYIEWLQAGER